ncbi:MAG TPA: divalent-cation tolerance protein CutA [Terriglobales bacterium]|jgi:periplasmic divalent cation tolerance protein|nr:divalent-cation tolerance protein CutA [Terriglobales bacterium]
MTDKRVVLTTTPSEEEARQIARALVGERLAACVNIIPKVESIYRWQDKVEEAEEYLLLIKTTESAFALLQEKLKELHSYELPECVALAMTAGSPSYLKWIDDSVD